MEQLQIIQDNGRLLVGSLDVADMIGKSHAKLMRDIRTYCEYLIEAKVGLNEFFIENQYTDSIGRTLPCYLITRKGCDMVANKMIGQKGVVFTAAYVTKFEAMEKQLAQNQFNLPTTYKEALIQLLNQVDKNEKLEMQNQYLLPKAQTYDMVMDADGTFSMNQVAKSVGMGEYKLFQFLRNQKILFREGIDNIPYERFRKNKCFKVVMTKDPRGQGHSTTKVYPKGVDYICKIIAKSEKAVA